MVFIDNKRAAIKTATRKKSNFWGSPQYSMVALYLKYKNIKTYCGSVFKSLTYTQVHHSAPSTSFPEEYTWVHPQE
jgi:hypothetical protein